MAALSTSHKTGATELTTMDNDPPSEADPSLGSYDYRESSNFRRVRAVCQRRSRAGADLRTLLANLFVLAWIAPAIFLLVINCRGLILGASAWCPRGHCWVDAYDNTTTVSQQLMGHYDKENHNLLGYLQLVSKALEAWFVLSAVRMIYALTLRMADRPSGLPLRYATLSSEFKDIAALLDSSVWASAHSGRMTLLVVLAMVLCILCNFMGPATAVLAIPALQWVETPRYGDEYYVGYYGTHSVGSWAFNDSNCRAGEFDSLKFSCTLDKWGASLDSMAASLVASHTQNVEGNGRLVIMSQQSHVMLYLNGSKRFASHDLARMTLWVPSRQLLDEFSNDRDIIVNMSRGLNAKEIGIDQGLFGSYAPYNDSLQMMLQRHGPISGFFPNVNAPSFWWSTVIDANRSVVCFSNYEVSFPLDPNVNNFTKCIQANMAGLGWNRTSTFPMTTFTVNGSFTPSGEAISPPVVVQIITSDRAVFLPNGTLPDVLTNSTYANDTSKFQVECVEPLPPNKTVADMQLHCDWNWFFNDLDMNDYASSDFAHGVTTFLISQNQTGMAVDFTVAQDFVTYSFYPGSSTNPTGVVETPELPTRANGLIIHYLWCLAAWSVDYVNGTVPATRPIALYLLKAMDWVRMGALNPDDPAVYALWASTLLPTLQVLSLIDYGLTTNATELDDAQPLQRNARIYVWAYGLGSRTSYLGVMIVSIGVLVVLAQFFLGLFERRQKKGLTQLLVGALVHVPHNDFHGHAEDEDQAARTPFRLVEDRDKAGLLRFESVT